MNREIIVRGQREIGGKWYIGYYGKTAKNDVYIDTIPEIKSWGCIQEHIIVIRRTIGQFTGLLDKNGKQIFEGDNINANCILTDSNGYETSIIITGIVQYSNDYSCYSFTDNIKQPLNNYCNFLYQCENIEVVGNIHDNPEFLKIN